MTDSPQALPLIVYKYLCFHELTNLPSKDIIYFNVLPGRNFHDCCVKRHKYCVNFHTTKGGRSIDELNEATSGFPALWLAIWLDQPESVRFLIENGANVNFTSAEGRTALFLAILSSDRSVAFNIVSLLVNNGANVNARHRCGETILHAGAACGYAEIVQLLLSRGADWEEPLSNRRRNTLTPLRYMIEFCDPYNKDVESLLREHERTTFGRRSHTAYLDTALALVALRLPAYVVLWILDYLPEFCGKPEVRKIRLLERVWCAAATSARRRRDEK